MTITVTIEELRDYETAMDEWCGNRSQEIERLLREAPIEMHHASYEMRRSERAIERVGKAITEWDAANPKPTLIPAV